MNTNDYAMGWQQCTSDAGLCGAHNAENPPPPYYACTKRRRHTGMHDDMFTPPWGDPLASGEQTAREGRAEFSRVAELVHGNAVVSGGADRNTT